MAQNFLTTSRHGSIFYYRRRVPDELRLFIGKPYLVKSLDTPHRPAAVILARKYASRTDALFQHLRAMMNTDDDGYRFDYTLKVDLDIFGKVKAIAIDAQPEEQQAVQALMKTILTGNGGSESTSNGLNATKPFAAAIAEYMQKASGKPQTKATYKSKFAHAQTFFGGGAADLLKISQADIVRYSDHVKATVGHVTTQSHYISVVTGFLNWHRTRSDGLGQLTTKTLMPKRDTPESDDRDAFTLEQLHQLFLNATNYVRTIPSKFWVSIAPAFLGCRIEELCQINLQTDLGYDAGCDVWFLAFDGKADPDGVTRKSMKKVSSWRKVPIHSSLVRHGFVKFLQHQSQLGLQRPFQDEWKPREVDTDAGQIIKWSHYISRWGGRELSAIEAMYGLDANHDLAYFHSMRHTFKAVMGEAGVSSEISEALAGRRFGGADAERYEKLKQNHRRLSSEGIERGLGQIEKLLDAVMAA